jgi:enoyl-CoA hydratase/carnithine racemase
MSLIEIEDRGPVRHVVLNRPEKRNAFHGELVIALGAAIKDAADDHDVRVIVLRGNGPVFSSGVDVGGLASTGADVRNLRGFRREWIDACNLMEETAKPVIAAIHGACIGGALETALACDMRVVASDAILGLPETRLGLIPDVGGCSRLPALVGVGRAKELIKTSKMIDGTEAERIGLATRAVAAEELDAATQQLADELLGCAPVAVGLSKRVIDAAARPALALTLEQEVNIQQICFGTEDFKEAAMAFVEKRQPEFAGR